MYQLKFDENVCASCATHDCLTRCQYIKLDMEQAKEERRKILRGEDSRVLSECATRKYCLYGNHPFYQIVELQVARGIHPAPKPIKKQQIRMLAPEGKMDYRELSAPMIDMCAFGMFEKFSIQGKLFDGVSTISGNDIFCNLMYLHFEKNSVIKERLPKAVDNIRKYYVERKISRLKSFASMTSAMRHSKRGRPRSVSRSLSSRSISSSVLSIQNLRVLALGSS
jgi:hypothetical protein